MVLKIAKNHYSKSSFKIIGKQNLHTTSSIEFLVSHDAWITLQI